MDSSCFKALKNGFLLGRWWWDTQSPLQKPKGSWGANRPCLFPVFSPPDRYNCMKAWPAVKLRSWNLSIAFYFLVCILFVLEMSICLFSHARLQLYVAFPSWIRKDVMQNVSALLTCQPKTQAISSDQLDWGLLSVMLVARINESAIICFSSRCQHSSSGKRPSWRNGE